MLPVPKYSDLLRSLEAMRNVRAIATVIAGFVLAVAIFSAGMATLNMFAMFLFALVACLVAGFAANASGIVLMHQALEREPPSFGESLLGGMTSFLKLLAIFIILALVAVAYTIVVAIVLFLCKIPFAGPVLFALVLPVIVVVSGAAYVGLVFGGGLMAPAVWGGASIQEALVQFFTIMRDRLIETIIRYFLLTMLLLLIFGVVMAILGVGLGYTLGLSAGILSADVAGSFSSGLTDLVRSLRSASGYGVATVFGLGVLYALVLGVGFCVATMGGIRIYLAVSDGIDTSAMQQRLAARMEQARQRAAEIDQRMRAQPAAQPAVASGVVSPAPMAVPAVCPNCRGSIAADDVFCGNCGHRLR